MTQGEEAHYSDDHSRVTALRYCELCGRSDGDDETRGHDEARRALVALRAVLDGSAMDAAIVLWRCVAPVRSYQYIAARLGVSKMAVAHRVRSISATWPELGRMMELEGGAHGEAAVRIRSERLAAIDRLIGAKK